MRKIVSALASIALTAASWVAVSSPAEATPNLCTVGNSFSGGGSGATYNDPLLISTPDQLAYLVSLNEAATDGKFYKLTQNIDFQGCELDNALGNFSGDLNGNGKTVANYTIPTRTGGGLFARATTAVIANFSVDNAQVIGDGAYRGSVVGVTYQGTLLNNITVKNSRVSGTMYVGGIAGAIWEGAGAAFGDLRVIDSVVTSESFAGGISGGLSGFATITRVGAFSSTIQHVGSSMPSRFGGLFGMINRDVQVNIALTDSGFRGEIKTGATAGDGIGMLVGSVEDVTLTLNDVYAMGTVRAAVGSRVSGLATEMDGFQTGVNIDRSYVRSKFLSAANSAVELAAYPFTNSSGGLANSYLDTTTHSNWVSVPAGVGRTNQEMKTPTTYGNFAYTTGTAAVAAGSIGNSGWYFNSLVEGGFMALMWEYWRNPIVPCILGRFSYNGVGDCAPAPAGNYVAFTGSIAPTPCPAGTFQNSVGATACEPAQAGSYVPTSGQAVSTPCPAGTSSLAGATECFSTSTSYNGPALSGSSLLAQAGSTVTFRGSGLDSVTAVTIDGISIEIVGKSTSEISLKLPASLTAGSKDLVLTSSSGVITIQGILRLENGQTPSSTISNASVKRIGNNVRLMVDQVVGLGKVQFKINGKEIAWVRAVDAADPKLRQANGRTYFVRHAALSKGKNTIEVYVDGKRVKRVSYAK